MEGLDFSNLARTFSDEAIFNMTEAQKLASASLVWDLQCKGVGAKIKCSCPIRITGAKALKDHMKIAHGLECLTFTCAVCRPTASSLPDFLLNHRPRQDPIKGSGLSSFLSFFRMILKKTFVRYLMKSDTTQPQDQSSGPAELGRVWACSLRAWLNLAFRCVRILPRTILPYA